MKQNSNSQKFLSALNQRSQEIFKRIVEEYIETGEPVGSAHISRMLKNSLSSASVRNVMMDLEDLGLIAAPHISAGRAPTQLGLRFFVDAMLEIGAVDENEKRSISASIEQSVNASEFEDLQFEDLLTKASSMLSGLTNSAGMVITTKADMILKHIEFVRLDKQSAMVVLVGENGHIENRIIKLPKGLSDGALSEASNFLSHHVAGSTLAQAKNILFAQQKIDEAELDVLTKELVRSGLATMPHSASKAKPTLIVRGRANLINDTMASGELARVRELFDELESKQGLIDLLGDTEDGEGVRIFIGSENKLFSLSGSSVILSPFKDVSNNIVGALGVIGPTRLNYARIVPVVDYTAYVISKIVSAKE